jgi:hypothetical protein
MYCILQALVSGVHVYVGVPAVGAVAAAAAAAAAAETVIYLKLLVLSGSS